MKNKKIKKNILLSSLSLKKKNFIIKISSKKLKPNLYIKVVRFYTTTNIICLPTNDITQIADTVIPNVSENMREDVFKRAIDVPSHYNHYQISPVNSSESLFSDSGEFDEEFEKNYNKTHFSDKTPFQNKVFIENFIKKGNHTTLSLKEQIKNLGLSLDDDIKSVDLKIEKIEDINTKKVAVKLKNDYFNTNVERKKFIKEFIDLKVKFHKHKPCYDIKEKLLEQTLPRNIINLSLNQEKIAKELIKNFPDFNFMKINDAIYAAESLEFSNKINSMKVNQISKCYSNLHYYSYFAGYLETHLIYEAALKYDVNFNMLASYRQAAVIECALVDVISVTDNIVKLQGLIHQAVNFLVYHKDPILDQLPHDEIVRYCAYLVYRPDIAQEYIEIHTKYLTQEQISDINQQKKIDVNILESIEYEKELKMYWTKTRKFLADKNFIVTKETLEFWGNLFGKLTGNESFAKNLLNATNYPNEINKIGMQIYPFALNYGGLSVSLGEIEAGLKFRTGEEEKEFIEGIDLVKNPLPVPYVTFKKGGYSFSTVDFIKDLPKNVSISEETGVTLQTPENPVKLMEIKPFMQGQSLNQEVNQSFQKSLYDAHKKLAKTAKYSALIAAGSLFCIAACLNVTENTFSKSTYNCVKKNIKEKTIDC